YDMVSPHQIHATGQTRIVDGLYLAGQINGTSGYEEAAAQGLLGGLNAARRSQSLDEITLARDEAYIGVLMDDLVTKVPKEPYRMFTSRAEYRLLLRADNAPDRLTPRAIEIGLLDHHELGRQRKAHFQRRSELLQRGRELMKSTMIGDKSVWDRVLNADFSVSDLRVCLQTELEGAEDGIWRTLHADRRYEPYIVRQHAEIRRHAELERKPLPEWIDYNQFEALRTETRQALSKFRPSTFGQASRLEGLTPADLTLLSVLVKRARHERKEQNVQEESASC
ncbi:MAG: FAD-dependent oxidoreductase, partial [Phycisphaerales bacterium]|nr:FAD-dependent oxidoreductase [Phycisphaerales bacterium]